MVNFVLVALGLGLASEAKTDTQRLIAGAVLAASLSQALREIDERRG